MNSIILARVLPVFRSYVKSSSFQKSFSGRKSSSSICFAVGTKESLCVLKTSGNPAVFTTGMLQKRQVIQSFGLSTVSDISSSKVLPASNAGAVAQLLECSLEEIWKLTVKYDFFHHMSIQTIKEKIDVMKAFGLPVSFVRENPRLLYQVSAIELLQRLTVLKKKGLLDASHVLDLEHLPHHLECNKDIFRNGLSYLSAKLDAFEGCVSHKQYLMFRLGCTDQAAEKLLTSYPLNRRFSQIKLKKFLDFMLIEAKMSTDFILKNMKLSAFSLDRLRERLKVIQRVDYISSDRQKVFVWMMSEKKFQKDFGVYLV